jgi:hypothetical protein
LPFGFVGFSLTPTPSSMNSMPFFSRADAQGGIGHSFNEGFFRDVSANNWQFWLRRTLLKFEERAANFQPNTPTLFA